MTIDSANPHTARAAAVGGAFFLAPGVDLRLSAFNSAAGVRLLVSGQLLTIDGDVVPFNQTFTPTTARALSQVSWNPGDGWLLCAQVVAVAGTPRRGQCFCRLELVQGQSTALTAIGTILQGYVQDTTALAYPGSPIVSSVDGPGVLRSITGTDPAAGAEISETVPTNARWCVKGVRATLVTDATVANRNPALVFDDGAAELFRLYNTTFNCGASNTWLMNWIAIGSQITATTVLHMPLPVACVLMGGYRIQTVTTLLKPGDNWSAPQLLVEEWIED